MTSKDTIDISQLELSSPKVAPVAEPLTGKEKAGVSLTWGVISIVSIFLLAMLGVYLWGEIHFAGTLSQLTNTGHSGTVNLDQLNSLLNNVKERQQSFREFWYDTLQLILLNVLFPTLTALLGYVFGTSKNNSSS